MTQSGPFATVTEKRRWQTCHGFAPGKKSAGAAVAAATKKSSMKGRFFTLTPLAKNSIRFPASVRSTKTGIRLVPDVPPLRPEPYDKGFSPLIAPMWKGSKTILLHILPNKIPSNPDPPGQNPVWGGFGSSVGVRFEPRPVTPGKYPALRMVSSYHSNQLRVVRALLRNVRFWSAAWSK